MPYSPLFHAIINIGINDKKPTGGFLIPGDVPFEYVERITELIPLPKVGFRDNKEKPNEKD